MGSYLWEVAQHSWLSTTLYLHELEPEVVFNQINPKVTALLAYFNYPRLEVYLITCMGYAQARHGRSDQSHEEGKSIILDATLSSALLEYSV